MRFRTEIEVKPYGMHIDHTTPIVLLGSCFSDEIGSRLVADGFRATHNPFGPLFNPASIASCLEKAAAGYLYTAADLCQGPRGYHCLDFSTHYSGADAEGIPGRINAQMESLRMSLKDAVVFITLGTANVFERCDTGAIVGNCHKFPADFFRRRRLTPDQTVAHLESIVASLRRCGAKHVIFTVSPIRHLADGLHGNNISKATLLLAVEQLVESDSSVKYFPAYEMLLDDLRDYRFYANDLRHPSEMAVEYIYQQFGNAFFSAATLQTAAEARKAFKASQHRPIL